MTEDRYHRRLALWRTHGALERPNADEAAISRLLAGFSDEELAIAADNPDHSDAGRARALAELSARNKPASPPPLAAPGFLREADADAAVPKGLRGLERLLRWLGVLLFWPALLFVFAAAEPLTQLQEDALRAAHEAGALSESDYARRDAPRFGENSEPYGAAYMRRADIAPYAGAYLHQQQIASAAIAIALAGATLWVFGGMFRSRPARILLLRKFNNIDVDKRLRRFVARNLSPLGHVFVLADKHYRRPFFKLSDLIFYWSPTFWAPKLILIPWDLLRGRLNGSSAGGPVRVSSAQDYRRFGERVAERVSCNTQVMSTSRRSIMARTSDAWWQKVVLLLMFSADLIVVDLSDLTQGTEWELDRLSEFGLLNRTLFIVRKDATGALAVARERFGLWLQHGGLNPVVWRGLKSGAQEAQRAFERLSLKEGEAAPILFDNSGRALAPDQLHERMRAALKAGARAKAI